MKRLVGFIATPARVWRTLRRPPPAARCPASHREDQSAIGTDPHAPILGAERGKRQTRIANSRDAMQQMAIAWRSPPPHRVNSIRRAGCAAGMRSGPGRRTSAARCCAATEPSHFGERM